MESKIKILPRESLFRKFLSGIRNRAFKDKLFKRVFRDKKYLLELYNALNDSNYTDENELEVVTMEDVVFLKMKNDLSFIVGDTLNLYEHQSTVNKNIALRLFLYFARQYEVLVNAHNDSIYGRSAISLPFPQCIIFYNGDKKITDDSTLKLSDLFTIPDGKNPEDLIPAIECTVRIININYGHNTELAQKCKRLSEYSQFIQIVKDFDAMEPDRDKAMAMAVDKGIEMGILKDVLIPEKTEVKSMLLTEFDEKKYKRTLLKEGRCDTLDILIKVKEGSISRSEGAAMLEITEEKLSKLLD